MMETSSQINGLFNMKCSGSLKSGYIISMIEAMDLRNHFS